MPHGTLSWVRLLLPLLLATTVRGAHRTARYKRDAEADPVVLVESEGGRTASLVHQDSGLQYQLANGKGGYEFGYDTRGTAGGAKHFRHEKKDDDGTVTGHYGFIDANGDLHIIGYVTDALGNRVHTESHKIENYGQDLNNLLQEKVDEGRSSSVSANIDKLIKERAKKKLSARNTGSRSTRPSRASLASILSSYRQGITKGPTSTTTTDDFQEETRTVGDGPEPYFSDSNDEEDENLILITGKDRSSRNPRRSQTGSINYSIGDIFSEAPDNTFLVTPLGAVIGGQHSPISLTLRESGRDTSSYATPLPTLKSKSSSSVTSPVPSLFPGIPNIDLSAKSTTSVSPPFSLVSAFPSFFKNEQSSTTTNIVTERDSKGRSNLNTNNNIAFQTTQQQGFDNSSPASAPQLYPNIPSLDLTSEGQVESGRTILHSPNSFGGGTPNLNHLFNGNFNGNSQQIQNFQQDILNNFGTNNNKDWGINSNQQNFNTNNNIYDSNGNQIFPNNINNNNNNGIIRSNNNNLARNSFFAHNNNNNFVTSSNNNFGESSQNGGGVSFIGVDNGVSFTTFAPATGHSFSSSFSGTSSPQFVGNQQNNNNHQANFGNVPTISLGSQPVIIKRPSIILSQDPIFSTNNNNHNFLNNDNNGNVQPLLLSGISNGGNIISFDGNNQNGNINTHQGLGNNNGQSFDSLLFQINNDNNNLGTHQIFDNSNLFRQNQGNVGTQTSFNQNQFSNVQNKGGTFVTTNTPSFQTPNQGGGGSAIFVTSNPSSHFPNNNNQGGSNVIVSSTQNPFSGSNQPDFANQGPTYSTSGPSFQSPSLSGFPPVFNNSQFPSQFPIGTTPQNPSGIPCGPTLPGCGNPITHPVTTPSAGYGPPITSPSSGYSPPITSPSPGYGPPISSPSPDYGPPVTTPNPTYGVPSPTPSGAYGSPVTPSGDYGPPVTTPSGEYGAPVSPASSYGDDTSPYGSSVPLTTPSFQSTTYPSNKQQLTPVPVSSRPASYKAPTKRNRIRPVTVPPFSSGPTVTALAYGNKLPRGNDSHHPDLGSDLSITALGPHRAPVFINSTVYVTTTPLPEILNAIGLIPRLRTPSSLPPFARHRSAITTTFGPDHFPRFPRPLAETAIPLPTAPPPPHYHSTISPVTRTRGTPSSLLRSTLGSPDGDIFLSTRSPHTGPRGARRRKPGPPTRPSPTPSPTPPGFHHTSPNPFTGTPLPFGPHSQSPSLSFPHSSPTPRHSFPPVTPPIFSPSPFPPPFGHINHHEHPNIHGHSNPHGHFEHPPHAFPPPFIHHIHSPTRKSRPNSSHRGQSHISSSKENETSSYSSLKSGRSGTELHEPAHISQSHLSPTERSLQNRHEYDYSKTLSTPSPTKKTKRKRKKKTRVNGIDNEFAIIHPNPNSGVSAHFITGHHPPPHPPPPPLHHPQHPLLDNFPHNGFLPYDNGPPLLPGPGNGLPPNFPQGKRASLGSLGIAVEHVPGNPADGPDFISDLGPGPLHFYPPLPPAATFIGYSEPTLRADFENDASVDFSRAKKRKRKKDRGRGRNNEKH